MTAASGWPTAERQTMGMPRLSRPRWLSRASRRGVVGAVRRGRPGDRAPRRFLQCASRPATIGQPIWRGSSGASAFEIKRPGHDSQEGPLEGGVRRSQCDGVRPADGSAGTCPPTPPPARRRSGGQFVLIVLVVVVVGGSALEPRASRISRKQFSK